MKHRTENKIIEFISENECHPLNGYNIEKAFEIYARAEIKNEDDVLKAPGEFSSFLLTNLSQFKVLNDEDREVAIPIVINKLYENFARSLYKRARNLQYQFADMVTILAPSKRSKILDVAAGSVPLGSIRMARNLKRVSAMDMFVLPDRTLRKLGVNPIRELISENTDTSRYDMLVGNMPCQATNALILNAAKHNKPYFVRFCGCGLPKSSAGEIADNWREQLHELDNRLQFVTMETLTGNDNLGYVLDASPDQIAKIYAATERLDFNPLELLMSIMGDTLMMD